MANAPRQAGTKTAAPHPRRRPRRGCGSDADRPNDPRATGAVRAPAAEPRRHREGRARLQDQPVDQLGDRTKSPTAAVARDPSPTRLVQPAACLLRSRSREEPSTPVIPAGGSVPDSGDTPAQDGQPRRRPRRPSRSSLRRGPVPPGQQPKAFEPRNIESAECNQLEKIYGWTTKVFLVRDRDATDRGYPHPAGRLAVASR